MTGPEAPLPSLCGTSTGRGSRLSVVLVTLAVLAGLPLQVGTPQSAAAARETEQQDPSPADRDLRILVSIDQRWLWLVLGEDTVLSAPVGVGMARDFTYEGRRYHFATPRGRRVVRAKVRDPVWVPPDWHYYEKAASKGLEAVHLEPGQRVGLSDGTYVEVRGNQVGRVNSFGNFWPWTPGMEIILDGKIFVPPLNTEQRNIADALGPYKLDMGDGYLIHGTHHYNRDSVGQAVSHGCVRMRNADLTRLYELVEVGTPVVIF